MKIPALSLVVAALAAALTVTAEHNVEKSRSLRSVDRHGYVNVRRDASTTMAEQVNTPIGQKSTGNPIVPKGANLTSIPVGTDNHTLAIYWQDEPNNSQAKQAFVMIHGRLRDGATYWSTMTSILQSAVKDSYAAADKNAIIVAPQFYSSKLNANQYDDSELAWEDINAWQAGEAAIHPSASKETSFDALDALYDEFSNTDKYPALESLVFVGHGGGGQLINRYGIIAKEHANATLKVRYVTGDPSSSVYFTQDRPVNNTDIADKATCPLYDTWRYGFTNFTGTLDGLKTPQEYFAQSITRDVRYVIGYNDTSAGGDQYCMALLQGGKARRDRNLSWWKYINMLARTSEDVSGFPGNLTLDTLPDWSNISNNKLAHTLTVIQGADHNAAEVFGSDAGRTVLFEDDAANVAPGWRPKSSAHVSATQQSSSSGTPSTAATSKSSAVPAIKMQETSDALRSTSTPHAVLAAVAISSLLLLSLI